MSESEIVRRLFDFLAEKTANRPLLHVELHNDRAVCRRGDAQDPLGFETIDVLATDGKTQHPLEVQYVGMPGNVQVFIDGIWAAQDPALVLLRDELKRSLDKRGDREYAGAMLYVGERDARLLCTTFIGQMEFYFQEARLI